MLNADGTPHGGSGLVTIKTTKLTQYLANKKDWLIGIEATGGANHMVAELKKLGLTVVLINPNQFRGIANRRQKDRQKGCKSTCPSITSGLYSRGLS